MATSTWTIRTQESTRATATRNGEAWTSRDLDLVTACDDVPDAEVAQALGRTLYAIQSIRHAIAVGRNVGSTRVARSDRPYRGWVEGMGDE